MPKKNEAPKAEEPKAEAPAAKKYQPNLDTIEEVPEIEEAEAPKAEEPKIEAPQAEKSAAKKYQPNLDTIEEVPEIEESEKTAEEIFAARKLFHDLYPLKEDSNPFHGEKYRDPQTRKQGGGYTLGRSAGISVSVFALAATGKYSLEDLIDNSKLREEKAKMFDEVATRMKNTSPENQAWIAKQIYEGQKATEKLMNETAKKVDFSDPKILQNPTFCMMLHMSHLQFDAWQEMSHCQPEILKLAQADHPEMKKWANYKDWWTSRETPLATIQQGLTKQEKEAASILKGGGEDVVRGNTANVITQALAIKTVLSKLAVNQKTKAKVPLHEWFDTDTQAELMLLGSGVAQEGIYKKLGVLTKKPELAPKLIESIIDGSFTRRTTAKLDLNTGDLSLIGFPTEIEIEALANRDKFLEAAQKYQPKSDNLGVIEDEPELEEAAEKAEQEELRREKKIRKNVEDVESRALQRRNTFVERFGPNATLQDKENKADFKPECMKAYAEIQLPVPEGLTEEMVAIIALGVAMEPSKLTEKMTSSADYVVTKEGMVDFNQTYLVQNIIDGDHRTIDFSEHLVESRQKAKQILEDYQNGHPEGVQKALQNVVPQIMNTNENRQKKYGQETGACGEIGAWIDKMSRIPQLDIKIPEEQHTRLKIHAAQMKSIDSSYETYKKMIETRPEPGTPEREQLVAELLFQQAVTVESMADFPECKEVVDEQEARKIEKYCKYAGVKLDPNNPRSYQNFFGKVQIIVLETEDTDLKEFHHAKIDTFGVHLKNAYMRSRLTPAEYLLSTEGGEQELKDHFMEDIKKSDLFREMVNEPDMGKLSDKMKNVLFTFSRSFSEFSAKPLPVERKNLIFKDHEAKYEEVKKKSERDFELFFSAQIINEACEDALDALGTNSMFHIDSKELKDLKQKTKALQELLEPQKYHTQIDDNVKKALLDVYKSAAAYEEAKRRDAKVQDDDMEWAPSTRGGKARLKGSKIMQDIALRFFPDEVAKEMTIAENRKLEEQQKAAREQKAFPDKSILGKVVQEAQDNMNTDSATILKDNPKAKAESAGAAVARVIAAYQVCDAVKDMTYGQLMNTTKESSREKGIQDTKDWLNAAITDSANRLQGSPEFKEMVKGMTLADARKFANTADGGMLVNKYIQARQVHLAKENQKPMTQKVQVKQVNHQLEGNGPRKKN